MKEKSKLFFTAMLQVSLVAFNVKCITKDLIWLMLISSFFLSYTWAINSKKIAFGEQSDRLVYALGAMCGTGIGYLMAKIF